MNHKARSAGLVLPMAFAGPLIATLACGTPREPSDTSRLASRVIPPATRDTGRTGAVVHDSGAATIIREAGDYVYERERTPVTVSDKDFRGPYVNDDAVPRMWIATARLKSGTKRPEGRIIARIRSEAAYLPMGIDSGYNYIWRNSWDDRAAARWVTRIVSGSRSPRLHELVRDARKHEYTHGTDPREPRLVRIRVHSMGLGACLDDPICPTGHCGYY